MKAKVPFIFFPILLFATAIPAQDIPPVQPDSLRQDSISPDTTLLLSIDSLSGLSPADTLPLAPDSLSIGLGQITYSQDSLDAPVDYSAVDSMIYDISGQKIHLYGGAQVTYTTIKLKADYIEFDWATSIVAASGLPDSLGRTVGKPEFSDGDQVFEADSMRYNFQTRRGMVYDVKTAQNDVIVHSQRSKFISGQKVEGDTIKANDIIFSEDALFTTCQHEHPHFGIHSRKQKVIANKLVVVGPSNLEIMNVPTPLWLPFGFFPISKGRSTGLLFPRDYEYSPQWGFGLRDIGWFFPLGEYFNLSVTANVYVKGTWGVNAYSQYRKRYKYNGSFRIGYDVRRSEDNEGNISRPTSFGISLTHNQDRAAHPTNTFGGSINIQTNKFQSRVYNDAQNVLQNQLNSNFSFVKNWQDKPLTLNVGLTHSQNTQSSRVTINFPNVQFLTQTLYPFRRKERVGSEKWYETITLRYTGEARNRFEAADTTLFSRKTLQDAQFGVKHTAASGTSFKLFKYFNLNPGVNYEEVWYLKSLRKDFIPGLEIDTIENNAGTTFDTIRYGVVNDTIIPGFQSYRKFNANLTLNTQIFGTLLFKKGWLRGVRHLAKPSISLVYSPDYQDPDLGYIRTVQDERDPDLFSEYSIFDGSIFGGPPRSGRQMGLSYSLNNIFEAKYYSKKDSIEKKLKLFDNIIVSGNYNFAADSLKWSPVSMGGTTRFFKGITTLSARAVFDPYVVDENGRRIDRTVWRDRGAFLRFDQANANIATRLTVGKIRAIFQGKEEEVVEDLEEEAIRSREDRNKETDFLSLFENFNISHNIVMNWSRKPDGRDTFMISTHTVNMQGNIRLTDNWSVNVGNFGYDFARKGLSYPSIGFQRDLHCWEMSMSWQPTRGTYSFSIRVKPGTLDFLKIPYEQNNADAIRAFQ